MPLKTSLVVSERWANNPVNLIAGVDILIKLRVTMKSAANVLKKFLDPRKLTRSAGEKGRDASLSLFAQLFFSSLVRISWNFWGILFPLQSPQARCVFQNILIFELIFLLPFQECEYNHTAIRNRHSAYCSRHVCDDQRRDSARRRFWARRVRLMMTGGSPLLWGHSAWARRRHQACTKSDPAELIACMNNVNAAGFMAEYSFNIHAETAETEKLSNATFLFNSLAK